jgi:hypothetical protein
MPGFFMHATPEFTVTKSIGFKVVFLCGVETDAFPPGVDSSVPFYLGGAALLGAMGGAPRFDSLNGPAEGQHESTPHKRLNDSYYVAIKNITLNHRADNLSNVKRLRSRLTIRSVGPL